MAKRTKKSQSDTRKKVEDAVVTEEIAPKTDIPDAVEDVTPSEVTDAVEVTADETATPAPEPVAEPEVEPTPEPAREAAQTPVYADSNRENNVLLPMILGGVIAGGIGWGLAYLNQPVIDVPLEDRVAAQATEIADLQSAVGEIPEGVDLGPLADQIAANQDELTAQIGKLDGRIAQLEERIDAVEKQPSADGTLQDTAVAAFQRELDELRAQTEQMSADAAAALQATRDEAAAIEQNAVENARVATARAALAQVEGAMESGAPFGAALTDLADAIDTPIPAILTEASEGVPTLGQLQADFPAAARAALATARSEGASGDGDSGIGSFLRTQLNVRSVTPQEGDGADAVLSRAEAALREGRLNETLAEVAALPEVARGAISEWLVRAELRSDALAAADALSQSLTNN